jgi:hypothetical protein
VLAELHPYLVSNKSRRPLTGTVRPYNSAWISELAFQILGGPFYLQFPIKNSAETAYLIHFVWKGQRVASRQVVDALSLSPIKQGRARPKRRTISTIAEKKCWKRRVPD